ncbi:hypothetical protein YASMINEVIRUS_291 [Yasminevirus sp. GU-2018]|uniref:Uncharacterized protein n=1 Tax=Yasminevirus sp. GU-2018 TaxID=2420051 RepID=A0A5K0U7D0_9VIRU|nr:hypothetical protein YASMINEVIRUS_291 [Yasminevirus sp. GU-2018]
MTDFSLINKEKTIKSYGQENFHEILDNLMTIRQTIADGGHHHFAVFFRRDQIKWWEKGGPGSEFYSM